MVAKGRMRGRDSEGVWDGHGHTAMCKIDNQQGPTIEQGTLLVFCGSLDGRGVWQRMDTCVTMAESLCCSPETITALFVNQLYANTR